MPLIRKKKKNIDDKSQKTQIQIDGATVEFIEGPQGKDGIDGKSIIGPHGKDGRDGLDGNNGLDGKDGRDGLDGNNGLDGKDGRDGLDGSPDTAKQIADKLNSVKDILKVSTIQGFNEEINKRIPVQMIGSPRIKMAVEGVEASSPLGKLNVKGTGGTLTNDGQDFTLNLTGGGSVSSVNGKTGIVVLDKTDVGLVNVDNTSDLNKPVSTSQQTVINAKFTLPALTANSILFSDGTTIAQDNTNFNWNNTTKKLGLGTTTGSNDGRIRIGGAVSSAGRTSLGAYLTTESGTATDTTSSGTVATANGVALFGPAFASTLATTYTAASTLYIAGAPTAGANVTLTQAWAIYVASGNSRFGGGVTLGSYLQFGTSNQIIYDSNANEYLKFSTVASAVNELTIANSATGTGPVLSATGGDTNININFTPKGTGVVVNNSPVRLKGYTVATLPAGVEGDMTYVTDQLTTVTAKGVAPTGGGSVRCVVFYNGTAWVGI